MSALNSETVKRIVGAVPLPDNEISLSSAGVPIDAAVSGTDVRVTITLGFPAADIRDAYTQRVTAAIMEETDAANVAVTLDWQINAHAVQAALTPLKNVRNIIAVGSGKGGVGKSTTAVNLALALQQQGARVGVLDGDIYGPSQPRMLGVSGQTVESLDGKTMEPIESHGVQTVSMGFLVDENRPTIWRGPMVTQALSQLIFKTNWDDLDYLIVDLPPGTGDTQLTLTQKVPLSGAIIITTPQDISLLDARKGLKMFQKVKVPVLGIIENMSSHICSQCGYEEALFGSGGGAALAEESGVELLGQIPLDIVVREDADGGHPTVAARPESAIAQRYRDAARHAAVSLALRGGGRDA